MPSFAIRGFSLVSALLFAAPVFAELERCFEAHGGLAKWREYAGVEYSVTWNSSKGDEKDHELFDLRSRDGLITSDKFTLGSHRGEVWIKPGLDALGGRPPRFYMWTPFYFFGMPFVFADPGAQRDSLGKKMFQGEEYEAVKITFRKGTGDTPEDYYVAYVSKSGQLKLVYYIVTYPTMRQNKPIDQLEQHAIIFPEWQRTDGLLIPKIAPIHAWKDGNILGEPIATVKFSEVHFAKYPPDASKFAKPSDAAIAPLE